MDKERAADIIYLIPHQMSTFLSPQSQRYELLPHSSLFYTTNTICCLESCSSRITASPTHDLSWEGLTEGIWYNSRLKRSLITAGSSGTCPNACPNITLRFVFFFFISFLDFFDQDPFICVLALPAFLPQTSVLPLCVHDLTPSGLFR